VCGAKPSQGGARLTVSRREAWALPMTPSDGTDECQIRPPKAVAPVQIDRGYE